MTSAAWHPHQTPSPPQSGGEGRGEEAIYKSNAASRLKIPSPQPSPRASLRGEGAGFGAGVKLRATMTETAKRNAGVAHPGATSSDKTSAVPIFLLRVKALPCKSGKIPSMR